MVSGTTLKAIVRHYRSNARLRDRAKEDAWWRAKGEPLDEAIDRAACARTPWGRYSHQHRQSAAVLAECARRLQAIGKELASCTSFHDLFLRVERTLKDIRGVGELVIYDTADRIGHYLGLAPDRVYLHRGTREGAAALGLRQGDQTISVKQLPEELQVLSNREAEDVLCTYKSWIVRDQALARSDEHANGGR